MADHLATCTHLRVAAILLAVLSQSRLCDAQGTLRGRAMSSDPTPEQTINSQPYNSADREVMAALIDHGKSSALTQMFNSWTNGVSGISDVIESQLSAEQAQEQPPLSTTVGSGVPSHPAYDVEGMCPLKDFGARKTAADIVGSTLMRAVAVQNEFRTWAWRAGEKRPINPATDSSIVTGGPLSGWPLTPTWEDVLNVMGMFVLLPSLALTDGGNRATWFNNAARMGCWEPSPLFAGPMIFKYSSVYPRLIDPLQRRGFYTATAPQSSSFFNKDSLLFIDGERHQTVRSLLEQAGFARRYEVDQSLLQVIPALTDGTVDADTVARSIIPALMKAVWGAQPPADVNAAVEEYAKYGKYAIFGKVIEDYALGPIGIAAKIAENRKRVADWVTSTPFFDIMRAARDSDFGGHPWLLDSGALAANLADATLFAGVVGSTDLIHKCVNYQLRDAKHKVMFEENPERYLIELMRYDSAVTSVTEVLQGNATMVMSGREINFAAGTPVQLVLASANRDPVHFQSPDDFNPLRADLGDTLAWNAAARDVEARDFKKAPRHCPGFCLSLKVGTAVCAKMVGSYDSLKAVGKVGDSKVLCANFGTAPSDALWQPPSTWVPSPSYDYSNPTYEPVFKVVKQDVECKSSDLYIGKFSDVEACANAVKAAGGKFFIFGKAWWKAGWCYREWTRSRDCPEGFQSDWYDFYEIPDLNDDDVLQCKVDVMPVTVGGSSGLLTAKQYRDNTLMLAEVSGKVTGLAWRKYLCAWEHKLTCSAGSAQVESYEACCSLGWWGKSCTVPTQKSMTSSTALSTRQEQWQECRESGMTSFQADPPSDPKLSQTSPSTGQCLTLSIGATTETLREKFNGCPSWLNNVMNVFANANKASYDLYNAFIPDEARNHPIAWLVGKSPDSSLLDPQVFDTYTIGMTIAIIHIQLRTFQGRLKPAAELVPLPQSQDFLDRIFVNGFRGIAQTDIDHPSRGGIVDAAFELGEDCIMDTFREMELKDGLLDGSNTWEGLLGDSNGAALHCPNGQSHCTKKEFVLGIFSDYTTQDGDPTYPTQQIDFRGTYYKSDMWEDAAEKFLAFQHLAMHRLRAVPVDTAPSLDGIAAAFVVSTSAISGLKLRAGFARPGADLFFSSAGDPIMIRTPDGLEIWRATAPAVTWQYWKFVWRSSMLLYITLVDHLWATHYSVAEALAAASREGLPPTHPLRRLLSMSTFGSIAVNLAASHTLIGPDHLLQRSTPFKDFHEVAQTAEAAIPSMQESLGAIVDNAIFQTVHPTLQQLPFYEDGRLIFKGISNLVDKWAELYGNSWCAADGLVKDGSIKMFMQRFQAWTLGDNHASSDNAWLGLYSASGELVCTGFSKWLKTVLFAVSGFHRQVGSVADIASDPDFASVSNAVGEAFGRPRQHMQMALIAGSTARIMPKLVEDYSHLASGLGGTADAAAKILKEFQTDMVGAANEVDARNQKRAVPYLQMHPQYVETSLAV